MELKSWGSLSSLELCSTEHNMELHHAAIVKVGCRNREARTAKANPATACDPEPPLPRSGQTERTSHCNKTNALL